MGNLQAREMVEQLGSDNLRRAISWHLTSNHFPAIDNSMVEPCIEAIENANNKEWDKMVRLPEGVEYQGSSAAPTNAIINQHHLLMFLEENE